MPTYEYRREDGTTFEIRQRITEDPLETCPETGQKVERLISGSAGLIFKGDGFYVNDYSRSGDRSNGSTSNGSSSSSAETATTTDDSSSSTGASDD